MAELELLFFFFSECNCWYSSAQSVAIFISTAALGKNNRVVCQSVEKGHWEEAKGHWGVQFTSMYKLVLCFYASFPKNVLGKH